ncbi:Guanylate kinase [Penicillium frequentans]|nr:Guanylate kinase [Penicillium glabrum]
MASVWRGLTRIGQYATTVGPKSFQPFGTSVNNRVATVASAPVDSRIIVISGPSGVGKGTLIQKLFDAHPDTFAFTGAFVEHATFGGNHYGTSQRTISDQIAKGRVVVLDIEMHGVKQMKANPSIDARYIFISPPNFEALAKRLRGRGTEKDEAIQKRLAQAKAELDYADTGAHDKIIVNDDLQVACKELEDFVFPRGG